MGKIYRTQTFEFSTTNTIASNTGNTGLVLATVKICALNAISQLLQATISFG